MLCAMFLPYGILRKCIEKLSAIWPDLYLDTLILLVSQHADIKILGNLIHLE